MKNILKVINIKRKREYLFLFFIILLTSILETLTIGFFFPLVDLIINGKSSLYKLSYLFDIQIIQDLFKLEEKNIIIILLIVFFFLFSFKNLLTIIFNWRKEKFNFSLRHELSKKILENHILKNLDFFYKKNSSAYISQILNQSSSAAESINSLIFLLNEIVIFLFIFILVLMIDYKITVFSTGLLILFIFPYLLISKKKINLWASKKLIFDNNQIKNVYDIFSMLKYIKVHNLEKNFFTEYKKNNFYVNYYSRLISFLNFIPRQLLEFVTILIICLVIIYSILFNNSSSEVFPLIALFTLAASRIVPSINRISNSIQNFYSGIPSIKSISKEINKNAIKFKKIKIYRNFNQIKFQNISFKYKNKINIIDNFNFKMNAGDKILIKGPSGSGKTTLIDLIMGIRKPYKGSLYIDQKKNYFRLYKKLKISYIPQSSFIIDDTIKNNIIFPTDNYSYHDYNKIIDTVGLRSLIRNSKQGDNSHVGEGGSKISGGQKQRIILARSLIIKPQILILDEATNALDLKSERFIIKNILKFDKKMIVIIISHREIIKKSFSKIICLQVK